MITFGLGTLALITMGLGNAWRPAITSRIIEPVAPKEISFVSLPRDITFVNKEVKK